MKFNPLIKLIGILLIGCSVLFCGCGSNDGSVATTSSSTTDTTGTTTTTTDTDQTTTTGAVTISSGTLSLSTDKTAVKSDDSDMATIKATVLDANNIVVENVQVTFITNGGQLSAGTVLTDENGQATVEFSSGTVDKTNQTATITASVTNLNDALIPILINGSTVDISTDQTNISENDPASVTISVEDAGGVAVYNTKVTLTVDDSNKIVLDKTEGYTDTKGEVTLQVNAGSATGTGTLTAEALGAKATQSFNVSLAADKFGITSPSGDLIPLDTNSPLIIQANAPNLNDVVFTTTIGVWENGQDSITVSNSSGTVSAILSSSISGVATVQIQDSINTDTTDKIRIAIAAPAWAANQVLLQPSATVLATSSGSAVNSITLIAKVLDINEQPVGDAPVIFTISDGPSGGEYINPTVAYTNQYGVAQSTFYSGSLSSDENGVTIWAKVLNNAVVAPTKVQIRIGGTAGAVIVGDGTKIGDYPESNGTTYALPMSCVVVDANGNPVPGATVNLKAWPKYYRVPYVIREITKTDPKTGKTLEYIDHYYVTDWVPNEDLNYNLSLDASEDLNGDNQLTPLISYAGSVPSTVVTDENGVAVFDLVYNKTSCYWVQSTITASTVVLGNQYTGAVTFILRAAENEIDNLPGCPFDGAPPGYYNDEPDPTVPTQ